jgi:hypothetical protein
MPPATIALFGEGGGLPPIKLDGYVYFVVSGTYQFTHNEKIISEDYTSSGNMDRQTQNTRKHRWAMTLKVPRTSQNVELKQGTLESIGNITTLRASSDKEPPDDFLALYDIITNWDFSGDNTHRVYLLKEAEQPNNDDIGILQVPIQLWGMDRTQEGSFTADARIS